MSANSTGEKDLWKKIKKGDPEAKEYFLRSNFKLVHSICLKFTNHFSFEYDDLFQEGCIGLYNAIDKYDPGYGTSFATFAVPFILGEIRNYYKKQIKENYGIDAKIFFAIKKMRDNYLQKHGKEPSIQLIAEKTGILPEEVVQILDTYSKPSLAKNFDSFPNASLLLKEIIASLPPRERKIVFYRFFKGLKQEELGKILNISQKHVSRLEAKVKEKLMNYIQD